MTADDKAHMLRVRKSVIETLGKREYDRMAADFRYEIRRMMERDKCDAVTASKKLAAKYPFSSGSALALLIAATADVWEEKA